MKNGKRNHETKIPYLIDTQDGALEGVLDLETMSDDELITRLFEIPEAISEIVYRELAQELDNTKE
jgi:hypothetical protein